MKTIENIINAIDPLVYHVFKSKRTFSVHLVYLHYYHVQLLCKIGMSDSHRGLSFFPSLYPLLM